MLGTAGIFDVRSRKIPDVIWLIFGGIGAVLYAWDYDGMTPYHVITIFTSVFVGIILWRWRIAGLADAFAIFAMTVILPVHYEFVMMPILVLVLSLFTVVFATVLYNVILNLADLARSKKKLFSEFTNEPTHRKLFAFVSSHRKRGFEKFIILTESSMSISPSVKSFVFLSSRNEVIRNNQMESNGMYVQNIPPLMAYVFGITAFLLLPEILSILFS